MNATLRWTAALGLLALLSMPGCKGNINDDDQPLPLTLRASISSDSFQANDVSQAPSPSEDGRFVAYASSASNLIAGDTNGRSDIFIRDNLTGATRLASYGSGIDIFPSPPAGGFVFQFTLIELEIVIGSSNGDSTEPSLSADGVSVSYTSNATNVSVFPPTTAAFTNVYIFVPGHNLRLSMPDVSWSTLDTDGHSGNSSMARNGGNIVYESVATNLLPMGSADINGAVSDIFWYGPPGNKAISVRPDGRTANGASTNAKISADGTSAVFQSLATNIDPLDIDPVSDIYFRDLAGATTTLVSTNALGVKGNGASFDADISADGRFVVFASDATNLVPGDTNNQADIFIKDLVTGEVTRMSVNTGGLQADGPSRKPSLSTDGMIVSFESAATTLIDLDTNNMDDIFLRDRANNTTQRVSVRTFGGEAAGSSNAARLSADGRFIVLQSAAANLIENDTNSAMDVFIRGPLR